MSAVASRCNQDNAVRPVVLIGCRSASSPISECWRQQRAEAGDGSPAARARGSSPPISQEVPSYAHVQLICAVVTHGKIHAVIALSPDGERSRISAEPFPGTNFPLMLVVVTSIGLLSWLAHHGNRQPRNSRRHVIDGLRAWRRSVIHSTEDRAQTGKVGASTP